MANLSQQEMEKRLESLPEEVQELLYSPEMYTIIKQISSKHQLHIDQMDLLETETAQVLLGITDTSQFPKILTQSLKIDAGQADAIAKDIDGLLLVKIRDAMKKVYEQATAVPVAVPSNPPAVSAAPILAGKSVVMPSSVAAVPVAPTPVTPAPVPTPPAVTTPATAVPPAPQSGVSKGTLTSPSDAVPLDMQITAPMNETDVMFSEPTVSLPQKVEATQPAPETPIVTTPATKVETPPPPPIYKADPYREPIE